jgi:ABC-type methionine transport system ATPase subunit
MNQIRHWLPHVREQKMAQAQAIADYNKKLFFSKEWQNGIIDEYKNNFSTAMKIMTANITSAHSKKLQKLKPDSQVSDQRKENRKKIFETADIVRKRCNL